jgi:predicted GIY-YIG superfamily endonuclease
MPTFTYVYILESEVVPQQRYFGATDDLKQRLGEHNRGSSRHTSKYMPWRIRAAIAFRERHQAAVFEKYLKTHSGRVFSKRWF